MTNEPKFDELDASISSVISRGEFVSTGDEDTDALVRLASGLRGLASPGFRARLRTELAPRQSWRTRWPFAARGARIDGPANRPGTSWLRGQRPFLAAGSSCGLVAGACCISGFAAHVLGLAGAAAVTAFIHNTIPYFVALSIAGMVGWLLWVLRDQGVTPATLAGTVRRYGFALASSYAAVFGASMTLTMATGLY